MHFDSAWLSAIKKKLHQHENWLKPKPKPKPKREPKLQPQRKITFLKGKKFYTILSLCFLKCANNFNTR